MDPQFAPRCSLSRVVALEAGGVGSTGDVKESYDGCQLRAIPLADWRTPKASMGDYNNNNNNKTIKNFIKKKAKEDADRESLRRSPVGL